MSRLHSRGCEPGCQSGRGMLVAPHVLCGERKKGQVSGALHGRSQTALVLGAGACLATGLDLSSFREEPA